MRSNIDWVPVPGRARVPICEAFVVFAGKHKVPGTKTMKYNGWFDHYPVVSVKNEVEEFKAERWKKVAPDQLRRPEKFSVPNLLHERLGKPEMKIRWPLFNIFKVKFPYSHHLKATDEIFRLLQLQLMVNKRMRSCQVQILSRLLGCKSWFKHSRRKSWQNKSLCRWWIIAKFLPCPWSGHQFGPFIGIKKFRLEHWGKLVVAESRRIIFLNKIHIFLLL